MQGAMELDTIGIIACCIILILIALPFVARRMTRVLARRHRLRKTLELVLCVAVVGFILALSVTTVPLARKTLFLSYPSLPEISKLTGLAFPDGSQLLNSEFHFGQDCSLSAKVQMSHADLPEFVRSMRQTHSVEPLPGFPGMAAYDSAEYPDWWDPNPKRKHQYLLAQPKNTRWFDRSKILIGLDDKRFALIYLDWVGKDRR
jgi:hypothetical protein